MTTTPHPQQVKLRRHSWPLLRALRPAQWAKNVLLAVPMLVGHAVSLDNVLGVVVAFVAFSACSSAVYLINDLVDMDADRQHPHKRKRPLASGEIRPMSAVVGAALLMPLGVALGLALLPRAFTVILCGYIVTTTAYSLLLKRKLLVDVIVLAMLYVARIVAGGAAVEVVPSFWLLAFSLFLFLSLGIAKRYVELHELQLAHGDQPAGRAYVVADLDILRVFGPGAGLAAVVVLSLYINSPEVTLLYGRPWVLWFVALLLLYWICRVWLFAHRGALHHDPVLFALTDRNSYVVGAVVVVLALLAGSVGG